MLRPIAAGTTNQSTIIRIVDATTGIPEQAVNATTSGIALWYRRELGLVTAITETDLTNATSAHLDGGILHLDDGYYRVDLPDAAVTSGTAEGVLVGGAVTDMVVVGAYHQLVAATTESVNVVAMAANVLTASALASDAAREIATDVWVVGTTGSVGTVLAVGTTAIGAVSFAASAVDAAALASDAAREIATDVAVVMTTSAVQSVTNTVSANVVAMAANTLTASALAADAGAEIADAVWDEVSSGHVTAGTFGQRLYGIRSNTAQTGTSGSITLDTGAHASNDFYNGGLIVLTGGTGAGQARFVTDYTGASQLATVGVNWVVTPTNDTAFTIIPFSEISGATAPSAAQVADAVWDEARADHTSAGTYGLAVDATVATMGANTVTATALASDAAREVATDVWVVGTTGTVGGVLTIASGALDAAALASDAAREIATDVWVVGTTGSVGTVLAVGTTAITAASLAADAGAEIADAVWDEVSSGHVTAGTFGERLYGIRSSTAQTGTASTITLDTGAHASDSYYNGHLIVLTAGTGAGQARFITAYTGASQLATVGFNWVVTPTNDSRFVIVPFSNIGAVASVTSTVTANVVAMAANVLTASALASDAAREVASDVSTVMATGTVGTVSTVGTTGISAVSFAAGAIDAAAVAANAIGASELAADAAAEIADAVLGRNIEGGSSTGRTVTSALQALRNRVAIVTGTMTVYDVTDTAASWTAAVTTAAGNPVVEIDPA